MEGEYCVQQTSDDGFVIGGCSSSYGSGEYDVWLIKLTTSNYPPSTPSNPIPVNHATNVPVNVELQWSGGDPDKGDTVTYDVYFGDTTSPHKVADNQSETTYTPDELDYNTTYYWRIVAWGNHGAKKSGEMWCFTTKEVEQILEIKNISGGWGMVHVVIKNSGTKEVLNISRSIRFAGGLCLTGKETVGWISSLPPNSEIKVSSDMIIGFGLAEIQLNVNAPGLLRVSKTAKALVILFYVSVFYKTFFVKQRLFLLG